MSDILIKGMKTPKSCWSCDMPLSALKCPVQTEEEAMRYCSCRHKDCPIFPVRPHRDLIDRADLWVEINKICDRRDAGIITDLTCLQQILSAVRHAPAIIPAEEDEHT